MQGTCLLAWRVIFDMRKIRVLSVFSLFFDGGWRVCRCMCVDACAHTHLLRLGTRDVSRRVVMGCFESMKKSRWTKTQDKYVRIRVRSTHVYMNAVWRDEILD